MCDVGCEYPEFCDERWVTAAKDHRCCVCDERIPVGHRYHISAGKWEGVFNSFKHCARCWELYVKLCDDGMNDVPLELNCGEVYEGDDTEMLALAFVTPAEAQAFALRG